jgi:hypothetical protein
MTPAQFLGAFGKNKVKAKVSGTSPTRYSFAATRYRPNTQSLNLLNTYNICQSVFASPDYVTNNIRFCFQNWNNPTTSVGNGETAIVNTINIEALAIQVGGTAYSVTTNLPAQLTTGAFVLLDPINVPGGIPANTLIKLRVSFNVTTTGANTIACQIKNSTLGDQVQGGASTLSALVTNFASALNNTLFPSGVFAPNFAVAQGGDGRPAVLVIGDSIGFGQNEGPSLLWSLTRGVFGYIEHGLDDNTTSKRIACHNSCVPAQTPLQWTNAANWAGKLAAIQNVQTLCGDWPFDYIISQHGTNAVSSTPFGTMMKSYWTTVSAQLGNKPIIQVALLPCPNASTNFDALANEASGSFNGIGQNRWNFNDNIASYMPQIAGYIEPWKLSSYDLTTNRDKLAIQAYSSTLAAAYSGSGTISLTAAPRVGAQLLVNGFPGNTTAAWAAIALAVTGSGPYTVTMQVDGGAFAALGAGSVVIESLHDAAALHPSAWAHANLYPAAIVSWKQANGWV